MIEYQLPEPIFHNGIHSYYSPYQMQQAYAAGRESRYPLPDTLYPGSKDWITGDYAARVEWLHTMYENKKQEIKSLLQQIELAYQAGRESMRQESDSLARACNLADVDYATFLKIKAYMPVHPAPKPMTEGDQHDALRADAERYRWLRERKRNHASVGRIVDAEGMLDYISENTLDRRIDAAMGEKK